MVAANCGCAAGDGDGERQVAIGVDCAGCLQVLSRRDTLGERERNGMQSASDGATGRLERAHEVSDGRGEDEGRGRIWSCEGNPVAREVEIGRRGRGRGGVGPAGEEGGEWRQEEETGPEVHGRNDTPGGVRGERESRGGLPPMSPTPTSTDRSPGTPIRDEAAPWMGHPAGRQKG